MNANKAERATSTQAPEQVLSGLIARLEQASGPNRALDWEIHVSGGIEGVGAYGDHPRYSESIDAALTLVPEGYACSVDRNEDGSGAATVSPNYSDLALLSCSGREAAPAIALCIAALKARASALPVRTGGDLPLSQRE